MADQVVQRLEQPKTVDIDHGSPNISLKPFLISPFQKKGEAYDQEEVVSPKGEAIQKDPIFESDADRIQPKIQPIISEPPIADSPNSNPSIELDKPSPEKEESDLLEKELPSEKGFASGEAPPDDFLQLKSLAFQRETVLQKRSKNTHSETPPDLESRLNHSNGSGAPLPDDARSSMERAFGADFSDVRVHTGTSAVQMNQELGAQAFTHGFDIYFNEGKYDTDSSDGQKLLAHELTHTIQQNRTNGQIQTSSTLTLGANRITPLNTNHPYIQKSDPYKKWWERQQRKSEQQRQYYAKSKTKPEVKGKFLGYWKETTDAKITGGEEIKRPGATKNKEEEGFTSFQNALAYAGVEIANQDADGGVIIEGKDRFYAFTIEVHSWVYDFSRENVEAGGGDQLVTSGSEIVGIRAFVTKDGYAAPPTMSPSPSPSIPVTIVKRGRQSSSYKQSSKMPEEEGFKTILNDIKEGRELGLNAEAYVAMFKGMLKANAFRQLEENEQKLFEEQKKYETDQKNNKNWIRLKQIIKQDQELKKREDILSDRYAISNGALNRLNEILPQWEATKEMHTRYPKILENYRSQKASLEDQVPILKDLLETAKKARVRLRAEYPPLVVLDVEEIDAEKIDVKEISDSNYNILIRKRIVAGFDEIRQVISDVKTRIHEEDIPVNKLGPIVTETKEMMEVTEEKREMGDPLSVAVLDWLDSEDTTEAVITWVGTILSFILGVASIIASGGLSLFLGLAGSAIGIGTASYEFERADDLYSAAKAGEASGGHIVDPEEARFNYIMGWVNLVLAGLDIGIAAKSGTTLFKAGRITKGVANVRGTEILANLAPENIVRFDKSDALAANREK